MSFTSSGIGLDFEDSSCLVRAAWLSNLSFICWIDFSSYVRMIYWLCDWMGVCSGRVCVAEGCEGGGGGANW